MNLSDNLKKIRKDNNLSQEQLAEKLGISRQSVSKWESGVAYPEMDKVLQICQMFNLNIDELLNQDIKKIKENKEAKSNINKFIDDILNFITKTIDMFSNMKFKTKIKFLIEQVITIGLLILLFLVFGYLFLGIINKLFSFFDYNYYYFFILNILEAFYLIFSLVAGISIYLNVLKVRYLDYYVIIKNNNTQTENIKEDQNKISIEKPSETIVIRDPNHSEYRLIKGLFKCVIFLLKIFTAGIIFGLIIALIFQIILLVLSVLVIKTGMFFIGIFIALISSIIINLTIMYLLYNLIFNKKINQSKIGIILISSIVIMSIGIGLTLSSLKDFNYIRDIESNYYVDQTKVIKMNDDIVIDDFYNVEFIETNSEDLNITFRHSQYYALNIENISNKIYFSIYEKDPNLFELLRTYIKDFNNKNIIDYGNYKIYISTSRENIEKIKDNNKKYIEKQQQEYDSESYYNNQIYDLEEQIEEKNKKIYELEEIIKNYIMYKEQKSK